MVGADSVRSARHVLDDDGWVSRKLLSEVASNEAAPVSSPPPGASATTMVTVLPCHTDASDGSTVEGDVLAAAAPAAGDAAGEADGEPAGAAPGEAAGLSETVVGFGAVVGVDGALGEHAVSNAAAMEPRTEMQHRAADGTGSLKTFWELGHCSGATNVRGAPSSARRVPHGRAAWFVAPRCYVTGPDRSLVEAEHFDELAREERQVSNLVEDEVEERVCTSRAQ